jgi:16S rRNA (guanine527-N7)-methyltransferase
VLVAVLERSRALGFLGRGPVMDQIDHAERFGTALDRLVQERVGGVRGGGDGSGSKGTGGGAGDRRAADRGDEGLLVADLGAGGGVPSLPLAVSRSFLRLVLVDAARRRTAFCLWAAVELGVVDRVEVWTGRAEEFAHDPYRRGRFDAVVARGFGPPASVVECGAPLLRPGGRCVVSEPPGGRRWPAGGLARLGLEQVEAPAGVAVLARVGPVDDMFPRSAKARSQQPLFEI